MTEIHNIFLYINQKKVEPSTNGTGPLECLYREECKYNHTYHTAKTSSRIWSKTST